MTLVKSRARGINLADTFAFTGTVSGAGGGKVLQLQHSVLSTAASHNTNTFADMGLDVNITPSATSSKIFLIVNSYISCDTSTANVHFDLQRDSTTIIGDTVIRIPQEAQSVYRFYNLVFSWYDSPSTTSQIQYSLRARTNAGTMYLNRTGNNGSVPDIADSTITAMEIQG
tara:strand:+ start:73 stop:585 length:513 start_codon:yes stop_codon:yes gene_type:complete